MKMCLTPYVNNKGADQPAHPRSLTSTFVHYLDSMMCILAVPKVSRFYLASIAEQAGLNLTCSKISEVTFSHDVAQLLLQRCQGTSTVNFLNIRIPKTFVVITLKFELHIRLTQGCINAKK